MGQLTLPGQVSLGGYLAYTNVTTGCYMYYQPSSTVSGQHDRVVQNSCVDRRCNCRLIVGSIIGSDPIGYSFANIYGSEFQDMLLKAVLASHL